MTDFITEMLNLIEDDEIIITGHETIGSTVTVHVQKKLSPHFCPLCGQRMYSKGIYERTVNHPILQDGRKIILRVAKRKWRCSDNNCLYMCSDSFKSFAAYKHSSNILPFLIVRDMKNLNVPTNQIAEKYNISDTAVHTIFQQYVDLKRLPLSEIISIDEVYMNFDYAHKYPLVILDFLSGQPIDIVKSRRDKDTEAYFLSIPLSEREKVRFLICDMYKPYYYYIRRYFPNAKAVVDCFHVVKWINDRIRSYLNQVRRIYKKRDEQLLNSKNLMNNRNNKSIKSSREVYILSKFKWVLLEKRANIDYTADPRWDFFLKQYLDTYQKEKMFLEIDDRFSRLRDLKEQYFSFNGEAINDPDCAESKLNDLISFYSCCGDDIFSDFADLLKRYKPYIIRSYTFVTVTDSSGNKSVHRLTNSFIESFNNHPKNLRRASRGLTNFDYARNRILWATRSNPSILAIPRKPSEIYVPGKHRGNYNKNK